MALRLAIVVFVLCDAVYLGSGIKPSTKLDISDEVEVFGVNVDEMANSKKQNSEQLLLRQEFLLTHGKEPDIEVFSHDNAQSENLRNAAGADSVSIIINNVKTKNNQNDEVSKVKKEDPDIPVIKGYGGLSESEINQYLKPTKEVHRTYVPQNTPFIPRSDKRVINNRPFIPYQGPNIQYSRPYIECKTVSSPYYNYNVGTNNGYQETQEWGNQQSNHLYYDKSVPRTSTSCDCSGNSGSEWQSNWATPVNNPRPLYSWPSAAQVKPKVEIDGKLGKPLKPSK